MENNKELKALTERVIKQLNDFYNGNSWVTDNLEKKVFSLTPAAVSKKMQGHNHSVAELVAHIIAWRNFVVQKLNGNNDYDIEDNSTADWPEPVDWNAARKEFERPRSAKGSLTEVEVILIILPYPVSFIPGTINLTRS